MKTYIVEFKGRYLPEVCITINEYAMECGVEIVSTDTVYNDTGYHVVVLFRKAETKNDRD